ncbi:MAG: DNA translocase FtsK 4TM domain-containing protein [Flavobacteriaceae bacterium]|nr:DNA translocase FtsK 4TM domain-containing protein [Flavobacteriaceae bacterium]
MAKNKKVTPPELPPTEKSKRFQFTHKHRIVLGLFLMLFSVGLAISFISYFFNWQADQSTVWQWTDRAEKAGNLLNKFGALMAHLFVFRGFGIAVFIPTVLLFLSGLYLFLDISIKKLNMRWFWGMVHTIWLSVVLGFLTNKFLIFSGVVGAELNSFLQIYLGKAGLLLLLAFVLISYFVFRFDWNPKKTVDKVKSKTVDIDLATAETSDKNTNGDAEIAENEPKNTVFKWSPEKLEPTIKNHSVPENINHQDDLSIQIEETIDDDEDLDELEFTTETFKEETTYDENLSEKLLKDFGAFDPTLELSHYKFPTLDLLRDHSGGGGITINQEELEEYKNKIVDTLKNYKIEIAQIKATIGPTVTLYEIVPEAGVRISKIKNLEDDIALSLSALGIRIIAPMPGKGTIGIEVPNKNPTMVSMRSVIASQKFQKAEMELPMALGKTISNETFVVDLAKMPHLLLAGATGQGKSVGLNAILTSLIYKKHPAEIKFVLVDPKKVELTLYTKIERHFLAKLPDAEDAIITDVTKVVHTLNSMTIEMDSRYELLKDARVRDIKEYNKKFKERKLNPELGHKFLPYIVLVIDEFADLIMTAGKEIEMPIARLAQLARAIGIHLIIATQRPSVNVITGIIKANFPARIAFRVTSKIDSRTILDGSGADQLIGRGDMLFTQGNDLIRLQCAFVDTPEVDKITDFIGSQKAYADAYHLPEYIGEESGTSLDVDPADRDPLFRDAAEVLVNAQQGSASLLQRKLKLGYNRAGRLIDQLEAAGIVGPFEGSKARQVLFTDIVSLHKFLDNEGTF